MALDHAPLHRPGTRGLPRAHRDGPRGQSPGALYGARARLPVISRAPTDGDRQRRPDGNGFARTSSPNRSTSPLPRTPSGLELNAAGETNSGAIHANIHREQLDRARRAADRSGSTASTTTSTPGPTAVRGGHSIKAPAQDATYTANYRPDQRRLTRPTRAPWPRVIRGQDTWLDNTLSSRARRRLVLVRSRRRRLVTHRSWQPRRAITARPLRRMRPAARLIRLVAASNSRRSTASWMPAPTTSASSARKARSPRPCPTGCSFMQLAGRPAGALVIGWTSGSGQLHIAARCSTTRTSSVD